MNTRLKLLSVFFILPFYIFPQAKCYYFDQSTRIAYNVIDSTLYTGTCSSEFKNGKQKFICGFENGVILYSKSWNKKGILVDSTIYLNGFKKQKSFKFYETGELKEESTLYLSDKTLAGMDVYESEGNYITYWKNGKKQFETVYYNKSKNFVSEFYENGNLKSEGIYISVDTTKMLGISKADSIHNYYRENGTIKRIESWSKGKMVGISTDFNEDGSIKRKEEYENGNFIRYIK